MALFRPILQAQALKYRIVVITFYNICNTKNIKAFYGYFFEITQRIIELYINN